MNLICIQIKNVYVENLSLNTLFKPIVCPQYKNGILTTFKSTPFDILIKKLNKYNQHRNNFESDIYKET